jgi:hypothetical protein
MEVKRMELWAVSYFVVNIFGSIYQLIYDVTANQKLENNEFYQSVKGKGKLLLLLVTFMINLLFWLPFKLVSSIKKKEKEPMN